MSLPIKYCRVQSAKFCQNCSSDNPDDCVLRRCRDQTAAAVSTSRPRLPCFLQVAAIVSTNAIVLLCTCVRLLGPPAHDVLQAVGDGAQNARLGREGVQHLNTTVSPVYFVRMAFSLQMKDLMVWFNRPPRRYCRESPALRWAAAPPS